MFRNLYKTKCEFNVQLFFNKIHMYIYTYKKIYIYTVPKFFYNLFITDELYKSIIRI